MTFLESDIIIIGAGLTGLTAAYLLGKKGVSVNVIEARNRMGGRIFTTSTPKTTTQEMGATWLNKSHSYLLELLNDLDIDTFEQVTGGQAIYKADATSPVRLVSLPYNSTPSFRIKGGSFALIDALAGHLENHQLHLNQTVSSIERTDSQVLVRTNAKNYRASIVISTLPPYLLVNTITTQPPLPSTVLDVANNTHTWMGEAIKVALTFEQPFWKANNSSGTIYSNVGPVTEMYDHSNYENSHFALKGFMNGAYYTLTKNERLKIILNQLQKYYGTQVNQFLTYEETVWRNEPFTFLDYKTSVYPHQNNGHTIYRKPYLDGKLFIAGSETSANFPGYMDGAVGSAKFILTEIDKIAPSL